MDITEYYYPEFSIAEFLSSFGGILGLWLGVGVVQIGTEMKTNFRELMLIKNQRISREGLKKK